MGGRVILKWKPAGLLFCVVVIGCLFALSRRGGEDESPRTGLQRQQGGLVGDSDGTSAGLGIPRPVAETRVADFGGRAATASASSTVEAVLEAAEGCLLPNLDNLSINQSQLDSIWECMVSLDWTVVTASDLASWLCAADRHNLQESIVLGAALYTRQPDDALAYLSDFKPPCLGIRESGLQIMAIEAIEKVDPRWVQKLAVSMTPERLFTGSSSTQAILLAEHYIRNGNLSIATELEKGGRGEYGGSDEEIVRAARVSLFVTSTLQEDPNSSVNAWAYAESLLQSPTCPSQIGSTLAGFLTSKQTWPGGDSEPALRTLLLAMDSSHFAEQATMTVWLNCTPEGPEGCDKVLWKQIYEKAKFFASKHGLGESPQ